MKYVNISVYADGSVSESEVCLGHVGEHNFTRLAFNINSEIDSQVEFYRIVIGDFLSEKIYSQYGDLYLNISGNVLQEGIKFLQLIGYKMEDDIPTLVAKSDIITARIKPSVNAKMELEKDMEDRLETAQLILERNIKKAETMQIPELLGMLDRKIDKTESVDCIGRNSVILNDNKEYRFSFSEEINVSLPQNPEPNFTASITFIGTETPANITFDKKVYFVGTDCKDGVFSPIGEIKTVYYILVWYDGTFYHGSVRGVPYDYFG